MVLSVNHAMLSITWSHTYTPLCVYVLVYARVRHNAMP
eukprot:SAG22_NODE_14_length_33165_cov_13.196698_32_plen_38_part_00